MDQINGQGFSMEAASEGTPNRAHATLEPVAARASLRATPPLAGFERDDFLGDIG
jgi:hypothetical protein